MLLFHNFYIKILSRSNCPLGSIFVDFCWDFVGVKNGGDGGARDREICFYLYSAFRVFHIFRVFSSLFWRDVYAI